MSNIFHTLAVKSIPIVPKQIVGMIAKPYVAGTTIQSAISKAMELNVAGFSTTIDILGEFVTKLPECDATVAEYKSLLDTIHENKVNATVSLKLTHIGLALDTEQAWKNLQNILERADSYGISVTIDMENSPYTDTTLEFYHKAREITQNVRTVIQAYLFRSENDMDNLHKLGTKLRLCKGIYKESEAIAFQKFEEVRENYIKLAGKYLLRGGYLGLATHDLEIIRRIVDFIDQHKIPNEQYEFQSLLGVPIMKTLQKLLDEGRNVKIYIPYGEQWFEYCKRRLKENPDIVGYIIKNKFVKR